MYVFSINILICMSSTCLELELPYHNCVYNCLLEDKPSGSKHVEDIEIKNWNINLQNVHFVSLCGIKQTSSYLLKIPVTLWMEYSAEF